jgi:hypothetical protein
MIRKVTCKKCNSTDINITWKYKKEEEISMYLGHDGFGFQFEDAIIKCAKCGSKDLSNELYNLFGRKIKGEKTE